MSGDQFPKTAEQWLRLTRTDKGMRTLTKFKADDPEAYQKLRDEAMRLGKSSRGARRPPAGQPFHGGSRNTAL